TRRRRQADLLGQIGHRDAPLALQDVEDFQVDSVEVGHFHCRRSLWRRIAAKGTRRRRDFSEVYGASEHTLEILTVRKGMTMKVIVLGAGVIGVTTAYYLARAGAEVTLFDRQAGPAEETSFANAGQVSPGYSTPWAAPGIPLKALKWMFKKHAPLSIRPDGTLFQLRWMAAML